MITDVLSLPACKEEEGVLLRAPVTILCPLPRGSLPFSQATGMAQPPFIRELRAKQTFLIPRAQQPPQHLGVTNTQLIK